MEIPTSDHPYPERHTARKDTIERLGDRRIRQLLALSDRDLLGERTSAANSLGILRRSVARERTELSLEQMALIDRARKAVVRYESALLEILQELTGLDDAAWRRYLDSTYSNLPLLEGLAPTEE